MCRVVRWLYRVLYIVPLARSVVLWQRPPHLPRRLRQNHYLPERLQQRRVQRRNYNSASTSHTADVSGRAVRVRKDVR